MGGSGGRPLRELAGLLDAVTVGQVTPGPVFTTATFIGYVLAGAPRAMVATVGIFLPAFIFVAGSAPFLPRLRKSPTAGAFLDGLNAASLALMAVVTWQLGRVAPGGRADRRARRRQRRAAAEIQGERDLAGDRRRPGRPRFEGRRCAVMFGVILPAYAFIQANQKSWRVALLSRGSGWRWRRGCAPPPLRRSYWTFRTPFIINR